MPDGVSFYPTVINDDGKVLSSASKVTMSPPTDVKEVVDSEIKYVRPTPPPGSLLMASLYVIMYREWHFREAQLSLLLLVQCR